MDFVTAGFGLCLAVILIALAVHDQRTMLLPNWLTASLAAAGLAQAALSGTPTLLDAVLAAFVAGLALFAVLAGYRKWRGIDGLGMGDVKLFAAGATWCGPTGIGPLLLVATSSAALIVVVRWLALKQFSARARFPFGPFLSLGTFVAWLLTHMAV